MVPAVKFGRLFTRAELASALMSIPKYLEPLERLELLGRLSEV